MQKILFLFSWRCKRFLSLFFVYKIQCTRGEEEESFPSWNQLFSIFWCSFFLYLSPIAMAIGLPGRKKDEEELFQLRSNCKAEKRIFHHSLSLCVVLSLCCMWIFDPGAKRIGIKGEISFCNWSTLLEIFFFHSHKHTHTHVQP